MKITTEKLIIGDSFTLGFLLPTNYDIERLEDVEIYIGGTLFENTITDKTIKCQLKSSDTILLQGEYKVFCCIDDSILGEKKLHVGNLCFGSTGASTSNESVNTGFDVAYLLAVTETTISVDSVFYDVMKGHDGVDGVDGVGIQSITLISTVGLVKTYRILFTDSTTFDYTVTDGEKGDKGDKGDVADQQYSVTILKKDIEWEKNWIKIPHFENLTRNREIKNVELTAGFGYGNIVLESITNYPTRLINNTTNYFGFYLRDVNSLLRIDTDFESITVKYDVSILTDSWKFDSLKQVLGNNVVFNDLDVDHSNAMQVIFSQIYTDFAYQKIQAILDPLTNYASLDWWYRSTYLDIKDADTLISPIGYGGITQDRASNPDVLNVTSHGENTFTRFDNGFTTGETFYSHIILVYSRIDDITTQSGTTFGYGGEFFEDQTKTAIDYPNFHPEVWSPFYQQSNACAIVAAKLRMIKDTTNANWNLVRLAARATAKKTVDGQFLAGQAWDMYRGYGIIQVADAIAYIESNYKDATSLAILADQLEASKGISGFLEYADLLPNSPISKKLLNEQLSTKENAGVAADLIDDLNLGSASQSSTTDFAPALTTDENYVSDAELSRLQSYPDLPETPVGKVLTDNGEFETMAGAVGGFANNLYLSNTDAASPVLSPTVKVLSYVADVAETTINESVTSAEGDKLFRTFMYPTGVSASLFPAGLFTFNLWGNVSSVNQTTFIGANYFKYSVLGVKTYLFPSIAWSDSIEHTTNAMIPIPYTTVNSTALEQDDRMGVDFFIKTTSSSSKTVTITLGDGNASYLNNPNTIRHLQLRAKNEELAYQHIDQTTEKTTIIDADSLAIWDSVALKFVRSTFDHFKTVLANTFGKLSTINDWALLQTFTTGIKSALFQDLLGNNPFVSQNGGTIYHKTKWFTPASGQTLTVSSDGLSVTLANPITNFQFTSGMPLAKLTVSGYERIINTFTSASVVTLTSPLPSTLFNAVIAYTDWGVTNRAIEISAGLIKTYLTNSSSSSASITRDRFIADRFTTSSNSASIEGYDDSFQLSNIFKLLWSGTSVYSGTKDTGFTKLFGGILQIYDGITSGTYRDLALRYIYQSVGIAVGDVVGNTRTSNQNGVYQLDTCTVANATKGAGTWKRTTGTTELGGTLVSLTNKTGANSVKGTVIYASATTDNAFNINPIDGDMPFGIVYENGIADGAECWVVVSGIAEVLLVDTVAATRSYVAYSSASIAGRIDTSATVPASMTHFREIGHTLESKTGGTNVLVKCVLHFN